MYNFKPNHGLSLLTTPSIKSSFQESIESSKTSSSKSSLPKFIILFQGELIFLVMLGKTSRPVIEILTGSLVSGNSAATAASASPRSHMESKTPSPRGGLKSYDFGGVGLGIVAALEKSGGDRNEIPALFGRNLTRSSPIPVNSPKNSWRNRREEIDMESLEEYTTIVTCHGPNKSYTKVYSNAAAADGGRKGDDRTPFRIQNNRATVFHISPARCAEASGIPAPDFLSSCNLCQKKLHGKDIYMYRGEKAFCSTECRYRQMVMDERKEKCAAEASRPAAAEVAGSPYANGQIFTTGILAI